MFLFMWKHTIGNRGEGMNGMIFPKTNKQIKGTYLSDNKTKQLLTRIKQNQIAVINHTDLDQIAADGLIEKKVKAIINFSNTLTGKYPTVGLKKVLKAKIPVFDVIEKHKAFHELVDGYDVLIDRNKFTIHFMLQNDKTVTIPMKEWTLEKWEKKNEEAMHNVGYELNRFIDNTLEFAKKEKEFVLKRMDIPPLKTNIHGKHVVVVVRGNNYRKDLFAIRSYIEDYRPILIGVDGGADALLEDGLTPHIIIGDMDSVSDKALRSGAEIIVHAYPDGKAPGLPRVEGIGLQANIIPSLGTSEDVAMLLAYEEGAEIIVALGAHSNMVDFLEKGRKGMASTVLVRMKIGTKLVDAKGVSKLYHPPTHWKNISLLGIAAITPILAITIINHDMIRLLHIIWMNIKMLFM